MTSCRPAARLGLGGWFGAGLLAAATFHDSSCPHAMQIVRCIGEGSFGRVYLATWHETTVACKVRPLASIFVCGSPAAAPRRGHALLRPPVSPAATRRAPTRPPPRCRRRIPPAPPRVSQVLLGSAQISSARDAEAALEASRQLMAQLDEEAGLMASLRHPNCVSFCARLRGQAGEAGWFSTGRARTGVQGRAAADSPQAVRSPACPATCAPSPSTLPQTPCATSRPA